MADVSDTTLDAPGDADRAGDHRQNVLDAVIYAARPFPEVVQNDLNALNDVQASNWTVADIEAAHDKGQVHVVGWYSGKDYIGVTVLQFDAINAGKVLDVIFAHARPGSGAIKRIMPVLVAEAKAHGCYGVRCFSTRPLDRLFPFKTVQRVFIHPIEGAN